MKLKDIPKEELQTMGYDEIASIILEESGKKMKLMDLFTKVCKALELPESTIENRIGDFFELLSINKKFVLLPKGYWDLATKHLQDIVVEDEEEVDEEEVNEETTEDIDDIEEDDENIYYDEDDIDDDDTSDDLDDLVIMDEEEIES